MSFHESLDREQKLQQEVDEIASAPSPDQPSGPRDSESTLRDEGKKRGVPASLPPSRFSARWGFLLIVLGLSVIVLAFVDIAFGLPFTMPRSWYSSRALWFLLAGGAFAAGVKLVRAPILDDEYTTHRPTSKPAWEKATLPSRPQKFSSLILYTRDGCHLCDVALELLNKHSSDLPPIQLVDIDTDPKLVEKFTTEVPVIEIDGKIRFRGRVNEVLLQRLIRHGDASL